MPLEFTLKSPDLQCCSELNVWAPNLSCLKKLKVAEMKMLRLAQSKSKLDNMPNEEFLYRMKVRGHYEVC